MLLTISLINLPFLLENSVNIEDVNVNAIKQASSNGHLEVIKYLVEVGVNIQPYYDRLIELATKYKHMNVVEYLKSLNLSQ